MDNKFIGNEKNILFYNDEEGNTKVEVLLENEDVWLNTEALAALFNVKRPAITKHINNIYEDEELEERRTCSKMEHMGNNGKQVYNTKYYNLDMIISIGFRVNSKKAIKFRTWANKIIKDYVVQGFALNDERFLKAKKSDQEYFKRLLERIKLIRTSERMFYQKITDIFSECSIDYDKNSDTAITFYKTIQNKFHYAITGKTAAEIVYQQADHTKENMGLTTWKNAPDGRILKSDTPIAKNYLDEKQIRRLERAVTGYFDYIEDLIERENTFTMEEFSKSVNEFLAFRRYDVLKDNGRVSHKQAVEKAYQEYDVFNKTQPIESDFDKMIKRLEKR